MKENRKCNLKVSVCSNMAMIAVTSLAGNIHTFFLLNLIKKEFKVHYKFLWLVILIAIVTTFISILMNSVLTTFIIYLMLHKREVKGSLLEIFGIVVHNLIPITVCSFVISSCLIYVYVVNEIDTMDFFKYSLVLAELTENYVNSIYIKLLKLSSYIVYFYFLLRKIKKYELNRR